MMRRTLALLSCLVLLMCGWSVTAQATDSPYSKGEMYLAPMAGVIFYLDEPNIDDHAIMGGRIGYFITENISLEGSFEYSFSEFNGPPPAEAYDGLNANHYFILLNGRYHFGTLLSENLFPYVLAGMGGGILETGIFGDTGFVGNYGAGIEYRLTDNLFLRSDIRHLLATSPSESDVILSVGVSLNFCGKEKPLPLPLPTPTPKDSDNDGVLDSKDECPGTPAGVIVDERGCPKDTDGDGVWDGIDQCPDTPKGAQVDERGCPTDSDQDGVLDGADQCPETPAGEKVDEVGCSFFQRGGVLQGINFDVNSAKIKPGSFPILDGAASSLMKYPNLVVEIGGHTDSTGSAALNAKLSQNRADSVKNYLVSKGVPASRMTTKGYGPSKPIADNATAEGRAKNRRIEFTASPSHP